MFLRPPATNPDAKEEIILTQARVGILPEIKLAPQVGSNSKESVSEAKAPEPAIITPDKLTEEDVQLEGVPNNQLSVQVETVRSQRDYPQQVEGEVDIVPGEEDSILSSLNSSNTYTYEAKRESISARPTYQEENTQYSRPSNSTRFPQNSDFLPAQSLFADRPTFFALPATTSNKIGLENNFLQCKNLLNVYKSESNPHVRSILLHAIQLKLQEINKQYKENIQDLVTHFNEAIINGPDIPATKDYVVEVNTSFNAANSPAKK